MASLLLLGAVITPVGNRLGNGTRCLRVAIASAISLRLLHAVQENVEHMVTLAHYSQSPPAWSFNQLSPPGAQRACGSSGMQPAPQQQQHEQQSQYHFGHQQAPPRKRTKQAVCQDFIQNLRARQGFELDTPGVVEGIQTHFQLLPSRYALDVNIDSLDVLNHKRLLDSARSDPSAVSFQVRRVEVPSSNGRQHRHSDQRAAFHSIDSHIVEVCHTASCRGSTAGFLGQVIELDCV